MHDFFVASVAFFDSVIIFSVWCLIVTVIIFYLIDRNQYQHAIRRNYPVIGRFRYWFEHLGEFLRQYFFAMDREEYPFNRADRSWVYRAAKDVDNTQAFGSTYEMNEVGSVLFVNSAYPVLEEEVQPPAKIVFGRDCLKPYETRSFFNISGMSYGAISRPAVEALSYGALKAGCWLNTGEGGLSPYHLKSGCDVIYQIGTAKYGVRNSEGRLDDDKLRSVAANEAVKMFEIKLSQGAKPGKGGILPGVKVTAEIAQIRGIPIGQDSLSPNGHPDIRSVDDLLDMINHVRDVTGKPVGFKAVISDVDWLDELLRTVNRRGVSSAPDFITIDSGDGGTGAAPPSLIDYMGISIKESLPMVVDQLSRHGLKHRVRVIASGKLVTPAGVAWAMCMGADVVVSARGFMFALGCIQSLKCNQNTCPTGIATHNKRLQQGLNSKVKRHRIANYQQSMVKEVSIIAHSCGVKEPQQLSREHARLVLDEGRSWRLSELYPEPESIAIKERQ